TPCFTVNPRPTPGRSASPVPPAGRRRCPAGAEGGRFLPSYFASLLVGGEARHPFRRMSPGIRLTTDPSSFNSPKRAPALAWYVAGKPPPPSLLPARGEKVPRRGG